MFAGESNTAWSSIASLAALGTNRAAQPLDALWPDASFAMPGDTPESTLLRVAAANYLWRLSGSRVAISEVEPVEKAPPVEEKLVSEAGAWRMSRMLNGEHRDLLPEWFVLVAHAGRVLPPHWVPVALDALKSSELEAAVPALGRRAIWLAARNPSWQLRDIKAPPSEERWSNGTLAERVAELAALRAVDPAAARGWIEKTWDVDPPEAREAFVRVLLNGLSAADEPFLEIALRDKRKAVRTVAVECLARLPTSAHALRALERVDPLLKFDPPGTGLLGKLKKRRLHVELPAALDKAAARDGIEASPPASRKIGERAWWLVQMVSLVPPSHWTTRFGCDARTLIDAVADTEFRSELLSALTEAAVRHADDAWLTALLQHFLDQQPAAESADATDGTILQLISAAPIASRERLVAQALGVIGDGRFPLVLGVLNVSGAHWSPETTRRAFELLGQRVRAESQQWSYPRSALAEWGRHAHVETAVAEIERVDARCPDPSPWRNAVEALKEIIEFRAAMRQELLT
jgi:hypothetical protein